MITYIALSPHPPIIIPEVGGDKIKEADSTVQAMKQMADELLSTKPDTVVFLTPHGNVFSDCITYLREPQLTGSLANFGRPDIRTSHSNDMVLAQDLTTRLELQDIRMVGVNRELAARHQLNAGIDHGILVPLYYLEKAGMKDIPIAAISVGLLNNTELYGIGKAIQDSAKRLGRRIAVVASGDMSHRLKSEGPYDVHPDGSRFDLSLKDFLAQGDVEGIMNLNPSVRKNAGECGYPSIVIMLGVLDGFEFRTRIFSYEGPFGVGYLVAGLTPGDSCPSIMEKLQARQKAILEARRAEESPPVKWARMTLESFVKEEAKPELPTDMGSLRNDRAGVFVSLKKNGQLRGCIGTFLPAYQNLAEEIKNNALAAGLHDPRFSRVEAEELPSLVYSVDILAEPEPCQRDDLDPKRYGVIVSSGSKRGLLLPDLEGVDTVEEQLQIALQKGGISPRDKYKIQRFEAKRFT